MRPGVRNTGAPNRETEPAARPGTKKPAIGLFPSARKIFSAPNVKWITLGDGESGDGVATGWREPISISGQGKAAWASYSAGGLVFLHIKSADAPCPAADPELAGQARPAESFGIRRIFVNGAHIGVRNDKPPGYLVRQMAA